MEEKLIDGQCLKIFVLQTRLVVGQHSKKLVTIMHFVIKAQNLVYVLTNALYTNLDIGPL